LEGDDVEEVGGGGRREGIFNSNKASPNKVLPFFKI
jgi:hypothetical protein